MYLHTQWKTAWQWQTYYAPRWPDRKQEILHLRFAILIGFITQILDKHIEIYSKLYFWSFEVHFTGIFVFHYALVKRVKLFVLKYTFCASYWILVWTKWMQTQQTIFQMLLSSHIPPLLCLYPFFIAMMSIRAKSSNTIS